jgi:hypothetical protein
VRGVTACPQVFGWHLGRRCVRLDCRRPGGVRAPRSARLCGDEGPFKLSDPAEHLQRENMPCGVEVLTASRWPTERARRSSRTTTRVSPARQHGSAAIGAEGMLYQDCGAAGHAQFVGGRRVHSRSGGLRRRFSGVRQHGEGYGLVTAPHTNQQGVCKRSFGEVAGCWPASGWLASRSVGRGVHDGHGPILAR